MGHSLMKNKEKIKADGAAYYLKNKERITARNNTWAKENKELRRASALRRREKILAEGICQSCNSPLIPNSKSYCLDHWFSNIAGHSLGKGRENGQAIKKKMEEQNYRCFYTGKILVPGINASLDHILPKRHYPEKTKDINNVRWVDLQVNYLKRDLTHEEFVAFCKMVAEKF